MPKLAPKPKKTWDDVDVKSTQMYDDDLGNSVYVFNSNQSSSTMANTGKAVMNPIHDRKEKATSRNSGRFR